MSTDVFYLRNPEMDAISRGNGYLFLRPELGPLIMSPVDVETVSQLLDDLFYPMAEVTLAERIDEEMRAFLLEKKVLIAGTEEELLQRVAPARAQGAKTFRHLVFGLTGTPGSAQVANYLSLMARRYCEQVDVILTESAQRFVRPELLTYNGLRVWTDAFAPRGEINVPHIHLAQVAEMMVIAPASAHTLYELAHGACSDLLSLTAVATAAPIVLIPAMSPSMWTNPAVVRNIAQLRSDGVYVISPRIDAGAAEPAPAAGANEVLADSGIRLAHLPLILASILDVHLGADMED